MTSLAVVLALALGGIVGFFYRDLRDRVAVLYEKLNEKPPEVGATFGEYAPVNELQRVNQPGDVGLVEAKTPQRVEWDSQQELEREVKESAR